MGRAVAAAALHGAQAGAGLLLLVVGGAAAACAAVIVDAADLHGHNTHKQLLKIDLCRKIE
jgi:hypothetical protein